MAEETLVDALLAQLEARRLMTGWCIASREDGRVCGAPAAQVDRQRGGLVCAAPRPPRWTGNAEGWCVRPMRRRQLLSTSAGGPPNG